MKSEISQDLGRLFEVGFNIGILAYIKYHQLNHKLGNLYRQDLQHLKFSKMLKSMLDNAQIVDPIESNIIDHWSQFLLLKGFLGGLNFFREYIKSTNWKSENIKILYYQCSFSGKNSMQTYHNYEEFKNILSQFSCLSSEDIKRYIFEYSGSGNAGEFLHADTLILLQYHKKFRILAVDMSVFSPKLAEETLDLDEIEAMRRLLQREIHYLRSKSVFSKLRIDTGSGEELGFDFSENLRRYLTAFNYKDKESYKLIQAGAYAHSFYRFLQQIQILKNDDFVIFNLVGYSNRGISAISLRQSHVNLLATCSDMYKNQPKDQDIEAARREILRIIQLNAGRSFTNGRKFVKQLMEVSSDTTNLIDHSEQIDDFSSTLELRKPHADSIIQALQSENTYIFLTGNPGIGKTTAIVNFLTNHIQEGFLFLYVSPRKQVNLDIIEKFKDKATGKLISPLFCLNSNSQVSQENQSSFAVNYLSNTYQGDFKKKLVTFLDLNYENKRYSSYKDQLYTKTEDEIGTKNQNRHGVLSSLCEAIHTVINEKISNNIVATACIQSLKMTPNGSTTLKHLKNIFKSAYNERDGIVNVQRMKEISSRIKHIFIMIDEITGDDSGVDFLNGITQILYDYELKDSQHGFNTKVIVADASIVDSNVIKQHLSETAPEPDKIFFRKAADTINNSIDIQQFQFKQLPAISINVNSYPAKTLNITYKLFVESIKFDESTFTEQKDSLKKTIQAQIVKDIQELCQRSDAQIIVYIQDKRRLQELITQIQYQRGEFNKNQDYIEIHASISENEKQEIEKYKNVAKLVFMTSSASRGLSFPKTKHILVEIPRFQVESNLMEVIQVIYRGRGNYWENGIEKTLDDQDKELIFYLGDRSVYYTEDPELSLRESRISLLNILLILRTCVMTRIKGYGKLGANHFLMIPIGGKSISSSGQTFSGQMANLIKDLKSEHHRHPSYQILQDVYTSLENLLSRAEFSINTSSTSSKKLISENYLRIRELFNRQFRQLIDNSLEELIKFGNIETGHITGSLLVVPIANQTLAETYEIQLMEIFTNATSELLDKMRQISFSKSYPQNLRSSIQNAIELVNKLKNPRNRTQFLEIMSEGIDQYYAIPLFSFIVGNLLREYFSNAPKEPENQKFRELMATYVHHLYPTDKTLPIGYNYQDFPFVVFRSYSLEEIREKIFTDKFLLTSNELNVLNLILSQGE